MVGGFIFGFDFRLFGFKQADKTERIDMEY